MEPVVRIAAPLRSRNRPEYLAALEGLIGGQPPQPSWASVEPSALPRALDHLDVVWLLRAKERLFKRPGFARTASLAEGADSADEFEPRCNALSDVLSQLTVPTVPKVKRSLNLLKAAIEQYLTEEDHMQRAIAAVDVLRDVIALRRGQAHSGAAAESLKAAARLGIRLNGNWRGRGIECGKSPARRPMP